MRSKSTKIISVLIALALSLNGGLPVIAEALLTGKEEIQDQVSEYVDDEVNQEGSEISEAVKVLIELVADLPEVSFITEENKEAILLDFEAVTIAYELLSEEDKVIFELTPQYTKLMAIQAMLFGTQLIPEQLDLLQRGEWNQAELSLDEQLEYIHLVQRLSEESGVMMMGLDDKDLPFQIGTATQLADLAAKVNAGNADFNAKSYILANDIDLAAYQSGTGWRPIGTYDSLFKGSFDGGGNVITGLVINNPSVNEQGLFGQIGTGGTVKNLGVVDCDIKGGSNVGGVSGINLGTIEHCYASGSVIGKGEFNGGSYVGGVVGSNDGGTLNNCYSAGSIRGSDFVGGVAGTNTNSESTIENCYSTASVNAISYFAGGVTGLNYGTIKNYYFTGNLNSGINGRGGITGAGATAKIENCVALNPSVSGEFNIGRVVGKYVGILTNNYAWSGMTGGGSDKTADSKDGADLTYTDGTLSKQFIEIFSDNAAWTFADNKLPILAGVGGDQSSDLPMWMTMAEDKNTFFISTAAQLKQLADDVNGGNDKDGKTYILTNDINLSAYQSDKGWTPIGIDSNQFNGTFDGNGKVITGLVIKNSITEHQGLFGVIEIGGTVKNLGVVDCNIIGNFYVGGAAGKNSGKIENCYTTGSVSGNYFAGGVAGYNDGKIENCYTTGSVSGNYLVGGVTGYNDDKIENCYSTSSISGNSYVGGVAGSNDSKIENCYATGSVSGSDSVGGVVGLNNDTTQNCTALNPSISGTANVGRVVGQHGGITLTGNYAWSGMSENVAGSDKPLDKGLDKVDGEDVIAIDGKLMKTGGSAFSWTSDLGFSENIWNIPTGTYKLPKLHGSNASYPDMPGGIAQEVIITQGKTEFIYAQGGVDITTAFNVLPAGVDVQYTTSTEGVSLNGSMLLLTAGQTGNTIVSLTATVDASSYHSSATLTTNITVSKTVVVVLHQNQTLTNQSWVMW